LVKRAVKEKKGQWNGKKKGDKERVEHGKKTLNGEDIASEDHQRKKNQGQKSREGRGCRSTREKKKQTPVIDGHVGKKRRNPPASKTRKCERTRRAKKAKQKGE